QLSQARQNPGLRLDQNPVLSEVFQKILRGNGSKRRYRPIKALREIVELRVNEIEITGTGDGVGDHGSPGRKIAARFHHVALAGRPRNAEMKLRGIRDRTVDRRPGAELARSGRRDADRGQNSCEKKQVSCSP